MKHPKNLLRRLRHKTKHHLQNPFRGYQKTGKTASGGAQKKSPYTGFYKGPNDTLHYIKKSAMFPGDDVAEVFTSKLMQIAVGKSAANCDFIASQDDGIVYIRSKAYEKFVPLYEHKFTSEFLSDIFIKKPFGGKTKSAKIISKLNEEQKQTLRKLLAVALVLGDYDVTFSNIGFYQEKNQQHVGKIDHGWGLVDLLRPDKGQVKLIGKRRLYLTRGGHKRLCPSNHFNDFGTFVRDPAFAMTLLQVAQQLQNEQKHSLKETFNQLKVEHGQMAIVALLDFARHLGFDFSHKQYLYQLYSEITQIRSLPDEDFSEAAKWRMIRNAALPYAHEADALMTEITSSLEQKLHERAQQAMVLSTCIHHQHDMKFAALHEKKAIAINFLSQIQFQNGFDVFASQYSKKDIGLRALRDAIKALGPIDKLHQDEIEVLVKLRDKLGASHPITKFLRHMAEKSLPNKYQDRAKLIKEAFLDIHNDLLKIRAMHPGDKGFDESLDTYHQKVTSVETLVQELLSRLASCDELLEVNQSKALQQSLAYFYQEVMTPPPYSEKTAHRIDGAFKRADSMLTAFAENAKHPSKHRQNVSPKSSSKKH